MMLTNFGKKIEIKEYHYFYCKMSQKRKDNQIVKEDEVNLLNYKYYPYVPIQEIKEKQISKLNDLRKDNSKPVITLDESIILEKKIYESPSSLDLNIQKSLEEINALEFKKNALKEELNTLENTIAETNKKLEHQIMEGNKAISVNDEFLKNQIVAISHNNNLFIEICNNISLYNSEISNKICTLNSINTQINDAETTLNEQQNQINANEDYLQQIETNINNSQQILTNNLTMLGFTNMMFNNPFYFNQMMSVLAGYFSSPEMYEVNEINE